MKRKRIRSIWVVLLTALTTVILAGGGAVAYLYWKDNFAKPKEESQSRPDQPKAEKIKGKNLVLATSDEEKLVLNFLNLENDQVIKKEIELGATLRGGKWAEANKNPLVQFEKEGRSFVFAETKEPSFSDEGAYFKIIKSDIESEGRETLIDSSNYGNYGNFVFSEGTSTSLSTGKIFYLKSQTDEKKGKEIWNLASFDLETKKDEILAENVGDFFQEALQFNQGRILSLYKQGAKIFEASLDAATGKLDKTFLFSFKKTADFDLAIEDIFPSPSREQFLYKEYSAKDGYSLKLYSLGTKKVSTLVKDKNFSFDKVSWLSENEVLFLRNPAVSNLTDEISKNEIVKVNLSTSNAEESLASSSNILTPLFFDKDSSFYLDGDKIIFLKDGDKKEFQIEGLSGASDILFIGVFEY